MENKYFEVAFLEFSLKINFGLVQLYGNLSLICTLLDQFILFFSQHFVKLASGFRLVTDLKAVTRCFHLHDVQLLIQTYKVKLNFVYFQIGTALSWLQQDSFLQLVEAYDDMTLVISEQTKTIDVDIFQLVLGLLEYPVDLVDVLLVLLLIVVFNFILAIVVSLQCLRHLVLQGIIDDPEEGVCFCQVLPHFVLLVF